MGLETLTGTTVYIDDLVPTNPVGSTDQVASLDDHVRGIKNVLQNTFPNANGPINFSVTEANYLTSASPGTGSASKALILSAARDISNINILTATTINQGANNVLDDSDIGSSVQAWDTNLDQLAALTPTNNYFITGNGSAWISETAANARTSMGLGSLATQNTVNNGDWSGTDLSVANGGTGASSASSARKNLGVHCGSVTSAGVGSGLTSGWSTSKTGTGQYLITHNLGTTNYVITVERISTGFNTDTVHAYTRGANSITIYTRQSGTQTDAAFDFILIEH